MIKKLQILLVGLIILSNWNGLLTEAKAAGGNLIANPSAESADINSQPSQWHQGQWGDNQVVFSYIEGGYNDAHSLRVEMASYISGDAKWYFEPVSVTPGKQYVFSNYYKASVETAVVAQVNDDAGNLSYQWLGNNPASADWKKGSFTFTAPDTASKISIFHFINQNGYLQTDNYFLGEYATEPISITNGVPNSSLEQVSSVDVNMPGGWQNNFWGTNSPTFSYLNEGHTGNRSVKVEIGNYTDGDAKWYFDPVPVVPGQTYRFSDYYKSNIISRVVVMVSTVNGTTSYFELARATPAATWTNYVGELTMPLGAKSASVFHLIGAVGYVTTDDYSFLPVVTEGFDRALVSITFDDGWRSQYRNAYPILTQYAMPATFYILSGYLKESMYMTASQVTGLKQAGHEIGSHTINHPDLTTLTDEELTNELDQSKQTLEAIVGSVNNFASPYGAYDNRVLNETQKYYASHRSVDEGYNSKNNFDPYQIKVQNVLSTTTRSELQGWLNQAAKDKTWLVLVYHQVDNSQGLYSTTQRNFVRHLQLIKDSGIKVVTVDQALTEIKAQIQP